jgi:hypothetical protein
MTSPAGDLRSDGTIHGLPFAAPSRVTPSRVNRDSVALFPFTVFPSFLFTLQPFLV